MSTQDKRVPVAIRRRTNGLEIEWPGAEVQLIPYRTARLACPCAGCIDEMTHRPILDPATVAGDITIEAMELVGAYGVKFRWSDGHGTGIYTFPVLHQMPG